MDVHACRLPIHLYGQMASHMKGFELLLELDEINRLLDVLRQTDICGDPNSIVLVKAAIFALAHVVFASPAG